MKKPKDLVAELQKLVSEQAKTSLVADVQGTPGGEELALGLLLMRWVERHAVGDGTHAVLRIAANAVEDVNHHRLAKTLRDLAAYKVGS